MVNICKSGHIASFLLSQNFYNHTLKGDAHYLVHWEKIVE